MDSGIVRKVDALGRVVIPSATRRLFNMREGDELTISVEGQSVKVEKLDATCTFCGSTEQVRSLHGKGICTNCTGVPPGARFVIGGLSAGDTSGLTMQTGTTLSSSGRTTSTWPAHISTGSDAPRSRHGLIRTGATWGAEEYSGGRGSL